MLDCSWSHNLPTYWKTVSPNWYWTHTFPKFYIESSWITDACHCTRHKLHLNSSSGSGVMKKFCLVGNGGVHPLLPFLHVWSVKGNQQNQSHRMFSKLTLLNFVDPVHCFLKIFKVFQENIGSVCSNYFDCSSDLTKFFWYVLYETIASWNQNVFQ